jgi:hypothetical protein
VGAVEYEATGNGIGTGTTQQATVRTSSVQAVQVVQSLRLRSNVQSRSSVRRFRIKIWLTLARDRLRYLHWLFEVKKGFGLSVLHNILRS